MSSLENLVQIIWSTITINKILFFFTTIICNLLLALTYREIIYIYIYIYIDIYAKWPEQRNDW